MKHRPLSSELEKKAQYELNEVSHLIFQNVKRLRKWIKHKSHLNCNTDEQWLLTFLRCCKFDIEKTKEKLDLFYTARCLLPNYFLNRDPSHPKITKILNLGICLPLLKTVDKDSPRIILYRIPSLELNIPFEDIMKTCWMINDILLNEDDNFVIAGNVNVLDVQDVTTNYLHRISPNDLKTALVSFDHVYPTRSKGFHLINTTHQSEIIFHLLRPMFSKKFQSLINITGKSNLEDIFELVPNYIIPLEYGGTGDSIIYLTDYWKSKVESYHDWFIRDSKYYSNEIKRSKLTKNLDHMFNLEGTFRNCE